MSGIKIVAIVLIAAGIIGIVVGQFTYTKQTHQVDLGPLQLKVKEKKTVNVPLWTGVVAIIAGASLLAVPKRT